jgi:hypothetical protein
MADARPASPPFHVRHPRAWPEDQTFRGAVREADFTLAGPSLRHSAALHLILGSRPRMTGQRVGRGEVALERSAECGRCKGPVRVES